MSPRFDDIAGKTFGNLTAIKRVNSVNGKTHWLCKCICGNTGEYRKDHLGKGITSCGRGECRAHRNRRHGHSTAGQSPTYKSWHHMRQRCTNPSTINYANYGGRGITVCERWSDFQNFLADMGERPLGKTIDRKENDRGYSKENCKWSTRAEQDANRRHKRIAA